MKSDKFPIKPESVLHRLLKMIAEKVAREFSVAITNTKPKKSGNTISRNAKPK